MSKAGAGANAMTGLKGGYSIFLMFGMVTQMANLALNPLGFGLSLMMGRKAISADKERELGARRAAAKAAQRKYIEEVTFLSAKDSRSSLRLIQRRIRDFYTTRASENLVSVANMLDAVKEAAKADDEHRAGQLAEVRVELKALAEFREQVNLVGTRAATEQPGESVSTHGSLLGAVTLVLRDAITAFAGTSQEQPLRDVLRRADEPLRVAIAGKVKAGKSTLLNALVGEELAPTNEGECTRIVTWYQNGHTYLVTVHSAGAVPQQAPFTRDDGAIEVDLGGRDPDQVERIVIDWPSRSLEKITLIDTPGIASLSVDVSARAHAFLTPDDDRVTEADAVLYLMKHMHSSDIGFLEAFHDEDVSQATPVNAIAVLARADEVGAGRLDSMSSASAIAARYAKDPNIRRLAQTVLPVAGLLAESASSMREAEFAHLTRLAAVTTKELDALLISVDRFANAPTASALTTAEREHLLERLGLYGVRLSVKLISDGDAKTSAELAELLVQQSGLRELQAALLSQFAERRDTLKARSSMLAIDAAIRALPDIDASLIADELDRIRAGAHEFNELRLLNALRSGIVRPETRRSRRHGTSAWNVGYGYPRTPRHRTWCRRPRTRYRRRRRHGAVATQGRKPHDWPRPCDRRKSPGPNLRRHLGVVAAIEGKRVHS